MSRRHADVQPRRTLAGAREGVGSVSEHDGPVMVLALRSVQRLEVGQSRVGQVHKVQARDLLQGPAARAQKSASEGQGARSAPRR